VRAPPEAQRSRAVLRLLLRRGGHTPFADAQSQTYPHAEANIIGIPEALVSGVAGSRDEPSHQ
jgi:hypothetical protein